MHSIRYDKTSGVMLYLTTSEKAEDAELEAIYNAYLRLDADALARGAAMTASVVVVASTPTERPNANWRRKLAELRLHLRTPRRLSVVITRSAILRGIMTLINWVQRPPPHEIMEFCATFEEGVRWMERQSGPKPEVLSRLLDEACAELGLSRGAIGGR
jgi:hypothetical protein